MANDDIEEINNDIKPILKEKGIIENKENIIKLMKE